LVACLEAAVRDRLRLPRIEVLIGPSPSID
jgi:hypothetical protein